MAFSKSVVKAQNILLCQLCEADSKIKWKCVECQLLMCTKCRDRIHPKFKDADKHEVLNLKEDGPQGEGGGHKLDFTRISCKQHQGQTCCLFCSSCDKLVCPSCVSKSHTGHKFTEVNEAYDLKIEHLKKSKGKLEKEKVDLTKGVQKLDNLKTTEDSKCMGVIHEIQHQRAVLKQEVDNNADNLIKEVEQKLGKIQDYISGEKMKVNNTIKHLENQSKMAESIINTTDVSNFFDEVNKIDQMLEEDVPPVNLIHKSTHKFVPGDKSFTTVGLIQDEIKTTDIRRQIFVTKEFSEEPQKTTTNMLKVTKLPSGTTEDSLEFFFANIRKYGGGDVDEIDYDEETATAIITFKDDDAVEKVLQKMPILFRKKIVEVEAYTAHVEPPLDITGEKLYDCTDDPHEQEAICTIEVQGMKSSTTEDTIMYYFESRKGANADVENIEFDEEKNRYLVTFEDEEAVSRALDKSHVIDGATVQVTKHVPPKRYLNKVLVKGLSEKTSKDDLINFLESRIPKDVETIDFGDEDSRKAIVTFSEPVDVSEIQTVCKKKALEGNTLTIHPVVVTNCIIVRGYSENTTERSLEYYFDNRRKSGVEGVTKTKMNHDEDYCVIYFKDPKDALIACQTTHTVDKCTLQVQVFYDCLGIPVGDEGPKFKPLAPIIIDNLEKRKIQFLLHSVQSKTDIEEQLNNMHARIIWSEKRFQSYLKIECTLTKDTKDCCKLAKTWGKDVRKKTLTFMDALADETHAPLQTAFDQVIQKLRKINISNPDGVDVHVENAPVCKIYIVGHQSSVKEVSDMIKTISEEVTKDLDREKQQIQEDIP